MATLGVSRATTLPGSTSRVRPKSCFPTARMCFSPRGPSPAIPPPAVRSQAEMKMYQARGMRTLGLAFNPQPKNHHGVDIEHIVDSMTWLGFVVIADSVRTEVPGAVAACRTAGI